MTLIDKFNIRVYGLVVKDQKILISHENIDGFQMKKFPGGGLEFGEGLLEGLEREMMEELGVSVASTRHIYTSEHFTASQFRPNEQVVAVYYAVELNHDDIHFQSIQPTRLGLENKLHMVWEDLNEDLLQVLSFDTDQSALKLMLEAQAQ